MNKLMNFLVQPWEPFTWEPFTLTPMSQAFHRNPVSR